MTPQHTAWKRGSEKIPLPEKVDQLRNSFNEVQKYELMTTNQYLKQMTLLLEILQDITNKVN